LIEEDRVVAARPSSLAAIGRNPPSWGGAFPPAIRPEIGLNSRKTAISPPGILRAKGIDVAGLSGRWAAIQEPDSREGPMRKILWLATSGLLSLGLATLAAQERPDDPPPPPKKKGDPAAKGERGPAGDIRKAYDLLRRIKADDSPEGRREERLKDWTDRAVALYRQGVRAIEADDPRAAHEYGAAAHDLARAIDHARNASRFERPDPELPPPPAGDGPEGDGAQARRELRRAYDRIRGADESPRGEVKFYLDAARDLYNAGRRDAQGDRAERAAELARAAEAMTHVPEHLLHATGDGPEPPKAKRDRPEPPKAKAKAKRDRPEPPKAKGKRDRPEPDDDLPPPID